EVSDPDDLPGAAVEAVELAVLRAGGHEVTATRGKKRWPGPPEVQVRHVAGDGLIGPDLAAGGRVEGDDRIRMISRRVGWYRLAAGGIPVRRIARREENEVAGGVDGGGLPDAAPDVPRWHRVPVAEGKLVEDRARVGVQHPESAAAVPDEHAAPGDGRRPVDRAIRRELPEQMKPLSGGIPRARWHAPRSIASPAAFVLDRGGG